MCGRLLSCESNRSNASHRATISICFVMYSLIQFLFLWLFYLLYNVALAITPAEVGNFFFAEIIYMNVRRGRVVCVAIENNKQTQCKFNVYPRTQSSLN